MTFPTLKRAAAVAGLLALSASSAFAAETSGDGNTAWMMTSTLLVLLMSLPGLALFYGGLVRTKNMLSVMTQCFAIGSVMMIAWVAYGYSLAFTANGSESLNPYIGGLSKAFLAGVTPASMAATFSNGIYIPEMVFIAFQMTFAVITPLLIVGALVERVKFSALLVFCILWSILAYYPMAHMVWYWGGPDIFGNASAAVIAAKALVAAATDPALLDAAQKALVTAGAVADEAAAKALTDPAAILAAAEAKMAAVTADVGKIFGWGALDFAGGTVVHINAGVAGLVGCLVLGKRIGYGKELMAPHSLTMTMIGAALLWVGWFGFNAGSNLEANGTAALAMLNTFVATAAAAVAWLFAEWIIKGKPSLLGTVSGVVAGLVAVTPACGWVGPMGAIVLGLVAGVVCFIASTSLKNALGYDDSLDVFGIHGVGGIIGALGTGILVNPAVLGGMGWADYTSVPGTLQAVAEGTFMAQVKAVALCVVWTGVVSFVLFKLLDLTMGLRVSPDQEREGLDLASHGERAYNY
jgi:ammonium transporter, Amt family